uniref:Nucleoid-associated protein YejK n=1 Tax=Pseudomonas aeruginosa TaxID=287 RepID=A0A6H0JL13_PSEAI|nr:nucleoid-associated protein YejK [Pseudomonas aeruginosa]
MPIKHAIVHLIEKKPDGTPAVLHARDAELGDSQAIENLLADLNESYNAKNKAWGFFQGESGAYPFSGWLGEYLEPAAPRACRSASRRTCWAPGSSTTRSATRCGSAAYPLSFATSSSAARRSRRARHERGSSPNPALPRRQVETCSLDHPAPGATSHLRRALRRRSLRPAPESPQLRRDL